jgi:hypothetical protein
VLTKYRINDNEILIKEKENAVPGMPRDKQEFSKILLAIDGSESSMAAADYAISITACYEGADLIVLHVLPEGVKKVSRENQYV